MRPDLSNILLLVASPRRTASACSDPVELSLALMRVRTFREAAQAAEAVYLEALHAEAPVWLEDVDNGGRRD